MGGRVGRSLVAITSLFFFSNLQMALAAGDGSCPGTPQATGGHHDGGFDLLGGLSEIWNATGGKAVSAVSSIDWSRVGRDALAFGKGLAVGAVTAIVATAVVAALVATFPAWGTAITVAAIAVGVAALAYTAWSVSKNWGQMSEADRFELGGNLIGGLAGGLGPGAALGRGIGTGAARGLGELVPALGQITARQTASLAASRAAAMLAGKEIAGRYLTPEELAGGHPTPTDRVVYHNATHTLNVAQMAEYLAAQRGLSPADSRFMGQVGLLHDWDPLRLPGTPARVPATLKALELDWTGEKPLLPGAKGSVLKDRFGWDELQYREARAMIQRTEFPFDQPHPAYGGTRPSDVYEQMLGEIPPSQRAFTMREGAILSEYADKASYYYMNDFQGASQSVEGLANEISQVSGKTVPASAMKATTGDFMGSIGTRNAFATDELIADRLGVDVSFPERGEIFPHLPPAYQQNFTDNLAGFRALSPPPAQPSAPAP